MIDGWKPSQDRPAIERSSNHFTFQNLDRTLSKPTPSDNKSKFNQIKSETMPIHWLVIPSKFHNEKSSSTFHAVRPYTKIISIWANSIEKRQPNGYSDQMACVIYRKWWTIVESLLNHSKIRTQDDLTVGRAGIPNTPFSHPLMEIWEGCSTLSDKTIPLQRH